MTAFDSLYWLVEAERAYHFAVGDEDRTRKHVAALALATRMHELHPYSKALMVSDWRDIANTIMGDYVRERNKR